MIVFARFLSFLFHPAVLLFPMPFFIIYRQTENTLPAFKWQVFTSAFILLGIFLAFLGRRKGFFSDHDLSKKEERYPFYQLMLFPVILYLGATLFLRGVFFSLSIVALGAVLGFTVFELFNKYVKVSVHAAVACAFVLTLSLLYGWGAFLVTLWIIPLIFWARTILKIHSPSEVMAGGFLGMAITIITFLVGRYLLTTQL